jgi:hypothetical protein
MTNDWIINFLAGRATTLNNCGCEKILNTLKTELDWSVAVSVVQ